MKEKIRPGVFGAQSRARNTCARSTRETFPTGARWPSCRIGGYTGPRSNAALRACASRWCVFIAVGCLGGGETGKRMDESASLVRKMVSALVNMEIDQQSLLLLTDDGKMLVFAT